MLIIILIINPLAYNQSTGNNIVSPEVMDDNSVIFRLYAPLSSQVKLTGTMISDYAEWDMEKKDGGIFEIKIGPLNPDMYVYTFLVDSIRIIDPNNRIVVRDGSHIESRLMIEGDQTALYDVKDVPHGRLTSIWYPAPSLNMNRRCMVYTPPGYDETDDRFPVLYLLHGGGGDEEAWVSRGRANYILDNLLNAGKIEPMIVVIPNGNPNMTSSPGESSIESMKSESAPVRSMVGEKIPESLVNDLIPFIEKNYRVKANKENRAIAGLSMGGYQTQKTTNKFPDMFNYIGVMSMGLYDQFEPDYSKENHVKQLEKLNSADSKVYWVACGKDDFLYSSLERLIKLYDDINFDYEYRESDGGHSWNNWRLYLTEFTPMLFK